MSTISDGSSPNLGVVCAHCRAGLVLDCDIGSVSKAFEVTCPMCGETRSYQEADVKVFESVANFTPGIGT